MEELHRARYVGRDGELPYLWLNHQLSTSSAHQPGSSPTPIISGFYGGFIP